MNAEIERRLERILPTVQKPARYVGGEYNQTVKDLAEVDTRVVFCFPDTYEIGMSNVGIRILYEAVNNMPGVWCERAFTPWGDMEDAMRTNGVPLYALESHDPLSDFDLIPISVGYEMSYTNILTMLDLGGIPLHASERKSLHNIVFAGGACTYNPEPLAEFFDFFSLGEGEESTVEIVDCYRAAKRAGLTKDEFLREVAKIPGVYVPSFYEHRYNPDGTLAQIVPLHGAPEKVTKRIVQSLDAAVFPTKPIVPSTEIIHDRVNLEVMRGCIRGCRFCQAGMIYRPNRHKSAEVLKKQADQLLRESGQDEISLSSLSTSDYPCLPELVNYLIGQYGQRQVNISLPSLRIDAFSLDVMSKVQDVSKSSLTFAPEAGSQRLRNVINKGLTEEDILHGAGEAFRGGWNKVKLYFMLGQPTETEEDRKDIAHLAEKIAEEYYEIPKEERNGKCSISISTSFFVPKPFTPFQWAVMYDPGDYLGFASTVNHEVKDMKNHKSIRYNWHEAYVTVLEGLLARGDRRVGAAIEEAYRQGALFDAWSEYWDWDRWVSAMEKTGVDLAFYTKRQRTEDELLPWDFIDCGVTKKFLLDEWHRALDGIVTPNCRENCNACGAMKYKCGICYDEVDGKKVLRI